MYVEVLALEQPKQTSFVAPPVVLYGNDLGIVRAHDFVIEGFDFLLIVQT